MKIIFLDVDGVLNDHLTLSKAHQAGSDTSTFALNRRLLDRLKTLVDSTGAKIVLSSSWRTTDTHSEHDVFLQRVLLMWDLRIYSRTPQLPVRMSSARCDDINAWMTQQRNLTAYIKGNMIIKSFVIIDDNEDAGFGFTDRFVQTDPSKGITDADVLKAQEILAKNLL